MNRLRSILTMFGVIVGVAAVVVLVAIGTGAKSDIEQQVQGLGSNLLLVVPGELKVGSLPSRSRLKLSDINQIARAVGSPEQVSAAVSSSEMIRAGNKKQYANVNGVSASTDKVFTLTVSRGEYLSQLDVDSRRRVVVLGAHTAKNLFGDVDPVGRQVTIAGVRFRVIGVFKPLGKSLGVDRDLESHIPITTAQRLYGTSRVDAFAIKAKSPADVDRVRMQALTVLEDRYPETEFSALSQEQILGVAGKILGILTLVLSAIAGISLVVGGVGVSNIMLVSVRERVREIGLRKAIGAKQRDIIAQFLIEAVTLTTLGGGLGIVTGVAISVAVDRFTELTATVAWWSPLVACAVSIGVGVIFGVFPARKAGKLDPVVALRQE